MLKVVLSLVLLGVAIATAYPQSNKNQKLPNYSVAPIPAYSPGPTPASSKSSVAPAVVPVTPSGPVNPFNLTFVVSARTLPTKKKGKIDIDPYIKVFHKTATLQEQSDWKPIGVTDTFTDNDNPDYNNVFSFVWTKGKNQMWHFEVKNKNTLKDDPVGFVDVNIDDYVLKNNQDLTVKLSDGGSLIIKKTTPVNIRLYARNVPKMDSFGGASDPFVECYWRKGRDGNDTLFYTTKIVNDVENADWDETIEFANYQKGTNQYWHFKVQDSDSVSGNDYIGDTLVEVDPYVQKRAAKIAKLNNDANKASKATLAITPA